MPLPGTLAFLYRHIRQSLRAAGIESADLDARLLIRRHTGLDLPHIISEPDRTIGPSELAGIGFDVERRLAGMPVSRIMGVREFWGLEFRIGPSTLDPRPDTETLVEIALDRLGGIDRPRILDLGTGSGCILVALLHEKPGAFGVGVDMSPDAAMMAQANSRACGVGDRASFLCGNWVESVVGGFDLIVSNPPYIPNQVIESLSAEVRNHDPILALAGGDDGLDCYRAILKEITDRLSKGALALFEIGLDQQSGVSRLVEDSGLSVRGVHLDLAGIPRVLEIGHGDK